MPTHQLPSTPKIRFIFKGFLITRIQDGASEAKLGIPAFSQCHRPKKIEIIEITPEFAENSQVLPVNPNQDFSLSVENVTQSGIRVFQESEPFNRLDDEHDPRDFRWVIDLEELHQKPLQVDETKLGPVIRMNNGLFYTFGRSPGEVKLKRFGSNTVKRFGRYGLDIGANIYFDRPDSRAIFKNGDAEILSVDAEQSSRYEIIFDCNCHTDTQESDFPLVYEVIGAGLTLQERVDLEGDPIRTGGNQNPEVYCGSSNISRGGGGG